MAIITSKDYNGVLRVLTHIVTGAQIAEGTKIETDHRGKETFVVNGGRAPQKSSSTGKVWTDKGEFYPSVVDCEWR